MRSASWNHTSAAAEMIAAAIMPGANDRRNLVQNVDNEVVNRASERSPFHRCEPLSSEQIADSGSAVCCTPLGGSEVAGICASLFPLLDTATDGSDENTRSALATNW